MGGTLYCAEKMSDSFAGLVGIINRETGRNLASDNRSCIVPLAEISGSRGVRVEGSEESMRGRWSRAKPIPGGIYDVANLVDAVDGGEYRVAIGTDTGGGISGTARFYGAEEIGNAPMKDKFGEAAQWGKKPLSSLVVIGHGQLARRIGNQGRSGGSEAR